MSPSKYQPENGLPRAVRALAMPVDLVKRAIEEHQSGIEAIKDLDPSVFDLGPSRPLAEPRPIDLIEQMRLARFAMIDAETLQVEQNKASGTWSDPRKSPAYLLAKAMYDDADRQLYEAHGHEVSGEY